MATAAKRKGGDEPSDEKVDLFIAPFQHEYSEAISAAREAAQTTATPAWQACYRRNIDDHRKVIKQATAEIEATCEAIEASDTYEEAEKDIAKAVKRLADERVRFGAWRTRAVHGYEATATNCKEIVSRALRMASEDERENPLLNNGLAVEVHKRVEAWPKAEWNEDAGAVVITERQS